MDSILRPLGRLLRCNPKRQKDGNHYKLQIAISVPPQRDAKGIWHKLEAKHIPGNNMNLISRLFAEETLGLDIASMIQHSPLEKPEIPLQWRNLSRGGKPYTCETKFRVCTTLSSSVIFGDWDPKGMFTGQEGDPFEGAVKINRPKAPKAPKSPESRSNSWMSKLSRKSEKSGKSSIWVSSKSAAFYRPPDLEETLPSSPGTLKLLQHDTFSPRAITAIPAIPPKPNQSTEGAGCMIVATGTVDHDDQMPSMSEIGVQMQNSTRDSTKRAYHAASGSAASPNSVQPEEAEVTSGDSPSTSKQDFGLQNSKSVTPDFRIDKVEDPGIEHAATSSLAPISLDSMADSSLLGNGGKRNTLRQTEHQGEALTLNFAPAGHGLAESYPRSMPSRYSCSSSKYHGDPSEYDTDDERQHSTLKSKQVDVRMVLPVLGAGVESVEVVRETVPSTHTESDLLRSSAKESGASDVKAGSSKEPKLDQDKQSVSKLRDSQEISLDRLESSSNFQHDTSPTPNEPQSYGEMTFPMKRYLESEENSTQTKERHPKSEKVWIHSSHTSSSPTKNRTKRCPTEATAGSKPSSNKSRSHHKKRTKNRWKPADLITPKPVEPSALGETDLEAAKKADEYWTWDDVVKAHYHRDSDTGSMIWYEDSGSEDLANL